MSDNVRIDVNQIIADTLLSVNKLAETLKIVSVELARLQTEVATLKLAGSVRQ